MDRVSKPLLGILVATVAFFALWVVALKPSKSTQNGGSGGVGQYQGAINQAHAAVGLADKTSAAQGGQVGPSTSAPAATGSAAPATTTPAPATSTPATTPAPAAKAATVQHAAAVKHAAAASHATAAASHATATARHAAAVKQAAAHTTATQVALVNRALRARKVLALLFFNAAAADDRAVTKELAAVPTNGHKVVKLAVPLTELTKFTAITEQVSVDGSPTLVIVDSKHQASTLVGFADRYEITQRIAGALAAK